MTPPVLWASQHDSTCSVGKSAWLHLFCGQVNMTPPVLWAKHWQVKHQLAADWRHTVISCNPMMPQHQCKGISDHFTMYCFLFSFLLFSFFLLSKLFSSFLPSTFTNWTRLVSWWSAGIHTWQSWCVEVRPDRSCWSFRIRQGQSWTVTPLHTHATTPQSMQPLKVQSTGTAVLSGIYFQVREMRISRRLVAIIMCSDDCWVFSLSTVHLILIIRSGGGGGWGGGSCIFYNVIPFLVIS